MKRLLPAVVIVLLLSSAVLAGLWNQYQQFLQTPLQTGSSGMVIVVEPGTNIRSLAARLEQQGATRSTGERASLLQGEPYGKFQRRVQGTT